MTSVALLFLHTLGFNFIAESRWILRTESKIIFFWKQILCNKKPKIKVCFFIGRYFLSPLSLKFLPMLKEMTIIFTDSSTGTAVDTAIVCRTGGLLQCTWVISYPSDLSSGQHKLGLGYGRLH